MSRLLNFFNALATRGGAIFVLIVMVGMDMWITLHLIHYGEDTSMMAGGLIAMLSGFGGALLLALKGSSDSTATTTTTPDGTTTSKASSGDAGASVTAPVVPPKV